MKISSFGTVRGLSGHAAPLVLAIYVFLSNHVAVITAMIRRPLGMQPLVTHNSSDVVLHLAWIAAFRDGFVIPNFHAPWLTKDELFNPLCMILGKLSAATGVGPDVIYTLSNFVFYVFGSYALFYLIRSFVQTTGQFILAAIAISCSVPLKAMLQAPAVLLGLRSPGELGSVWGITADGFLHGGVFLAALGSALVLLGFGLLARFLSTGSSRFLVGSCLTTFASALFHPFEAFALCGGGAAALALGYRRDRNRLIQAGLLCASFAAGLAPYIVVALWGTWMPEVARLNRWHAPPLWRVLLMCGLPTLLCLTAIIAGRRTVSERHTLLRCWFLAVLIGLYVPWLPWSQHLFFGFHACAGLLAAQEIRAIPLFTRLWTSHPRVLRAVAAAVVLLSLSAYPLVFWKDRDPASAVIRTSDAAVLTWMRANAETKSLVLAQERSARWYATVPMHSFASHWLSSITYRDQLNLSNAFFKGTMDRDAAARLLEDYGIRYVVAPADWRLRSEFLVGYEEKARFGSLAVYECPGRSMKPYWPAPK